MAIFLKYFFKSLLSNYLSDTDWLFFFIDGRVRGRALLFGRRATAFPSLFYPVMFFATFQVAIMFDPLRMLLKEAVQFVLVLA